MISCAKMKQKQARSETRGWGGQNFKMIFFVAGASWGGGAELEKKVDKIYTRGEIFFKKRSF